MNKVLFCLQRAAASALHTVNPGTAIRFILALALGLAANASVAQITIQAESYTSMSGVQTETTSDTGGGLNVGWIDTNDWMTYSVNLPTAGNYTVSYRVASLNGGGTIKLASGSNSAQVAVPKTSGWQTWQTITQVISLPAGQQTLTLTAITGGFNLNWIKLDPPVNSSSSSSSKSSSSSIISSTMPCNFSATLQAENYASMSGIQTETTSDTGGGLNVGWIDAGDWLTFAPITLPVSGTYRVSYRVASPNTTGLIQLERAGGGQTFGQIAVPNTGGWQSWVTVTQNLSLPSGSLSLAIAAIGGGFNINWIKIESLDSTCPVSSSSPSSSAPSNRAPTAAITYQFKQTPCPMGTVIISGATSSDPDGDALTYNWIVSNSGTTTTYTGVEISFFMQATKLYNIALTVTDPKGATGTTSIQISHSFTDNCISSSSSSRSSISSSSSLSSSSSSWSSDRNRYDAPRATTAPVIDGVMDAVWDKAPWAPIDVFWLGSQHPTAQDFSGRYKAMWDAGNLYLLFDITDDVIFDATANPLERYWDDDSVEIFIDENRNGGNHQYNTSAWAYHVSTLGDVVDFTNSTTVKLLNDHITVRRVSNGSKHMWEMSMRVYGENYVDGQANVPVPLFVGKLMGFSVCYNDNDASANRESMIGSVDTQGHKNDQGYIDASVFGTMRLIDAP